MIDGPILVLLGCVGAALVVATLVIRAAARHATGPREQAAAADVALRIRTWWILIPVMVAALAAGPKGILGFFAAVSFLALRELLTLVPSHRADHRTLVAAFFVVLPVQYALVWLGWRGLLVAFVPVFALLAISVRIALSGDPERFLRRVATLHYALMVGVYCPSHAPALLLLRVPGFEGHEHELVVFLVTVTQASDVAQFLWGKALGRVPLAPALSPSKTVEGHEHELVVFLVTVTQASDVAQFLWGKALGRVPLAPALSPSKTVEGLVGGCATATLIGALLTPLTPFSAPEATALAAVLSLCGAAGGLVMSAIKRDAGVKDFGALLPGHGGVLDRADSVVFAAPIFYHLVGWLHAAP